MTARLTGFRTRISSSRGDIGRQRKGFARWMHGCGVPDEVRADLEVVFSELVSNAQRAEPDGSSDVSVDADIERDAVVFEVTNRVGGGHLSGPDLSDPLRSGGRGLMVARAYTDDLMILATDGHMTVRCRRAF